MTLRTHGPLDLRLVIDPDSLGFDNTSELAQELLPWVGQERAEKAARFGLALDQPDYHLFVLGELGSGRTTLLSQLMLEMASGRPVPPDLCYLHNFDAPERPLALRLPAGQGRLLRQQMSELAKDLQTEIPRRLASQDFKTQSERIQRTFKTQETEAYAELSAFAEARHFSLHRDSGNLILTLRDAQGQPMTEKATLQLSKVQREEIDIAEEELRNAIHRYIEKMRPLERDNNQRLSHLQQQLVKPMLEGAMQSIRSSLRKQIKDAVKLGNYLDQVQRDLLDNLDLFQTPESDEDTHQAMLSLVLSRLRVNLVVDNSSLESAPVIVEDNPLSRTLFGNIEYQYEDEALVTDFSRIRAGSLLRAHGGYLMLHLRDLMADELLGEKLRRFLRNNRLQIEEPGLPMQPITAVSLVPEPVDVEVKIVLIASIEQYYALQASDPEFVRHFRVKVDFAESVPDHPKVRHASAILIAHTCIRLGLPHCSAGAVARLLEQAHREVDDQTRQSVVFADTEALLIESAALCRARSATRIEAIDVESALQARNYRHNYPEQRLIESVVDGERLIAVTGMRVGQLNNLTQVDLGDHRFGFPVRVSARTTAGEEGVLNIEREVEMTGPIHDKGIFILQSYLSALFGHMAPLALTAAITFEQEYEGLEGDSASCSEFLVLLSCLAGLPLRQDIAVSGALNQHGEILPVGAINEKVHGWFRLCQALGLSGQQGVLIPRRNLRHLMLDHALIAAVKDGLFHIHTAEHFSEALELLTGTPSGWTPAGGTFEEESVLGRAQKTLKAYRQACQAAASERSQPTPSRLKRSR